MAQGVGGLARALLQAGPAAESLSGCEDGELSLYTLWLFFLPLSMTVTTFLS